MLTIDLHIFVGTFERESSVKFLKLKLKCDKNVTQAVYMYVTFQSSV